MRPVRTEPSCAVAAAVIAGCAAVAAKSPAGELVIIISALAAATLAGKAAATAKTEAERPEDFAALIEEKLEGRVA